MAVITQTKTTCTKDSIVNCDPIVLTLSYIEGVAQMKILIFDTECNSLDTANGFIQEIAWIIVDTNKWRTLKAQSHIVAWDTFYPVDPGALAVTGLSREFCEEHGRKANNVFGDILSDAYNVSYICGHNAVGYDMPMLATNVKRSCFYPFSDSEFSRKTVLDTLTDVPYPPNLKIHALKYLAYDHGFILSDAHQALADVMACKHLLSSYNIDDVIKVASTPLVTLTAKIDFNDIESRDKIKNSRFYWNANRKLWEKRIRAYYLDSYQLSLGPEIELNQEHGSVINEAR